MRILRLIRTRPLALVLAAGVLSVGQGLAPMVATAISPTSPSVVVTYRTQWFEPFFPAVHLIGQVRNDTSQAVTGVRIGLNLQDAHGNSVGTQTAFPTLEALAPGEISPFEVILFPVPVGYTRWRSGDAPSHRAPPDFAGRFPAQCMHPPPDYV